MTGHSPSGRSDLLRLPGVRRQVARLADDLAAGRSCLWMLPDAFVPEGHADALHGTVLDRSPERYDLPPPGPALPAPRQPEASKRDADGPGAPHADVPLLDEFDDGFDIGWHPARTAVPTLPPNPGTQGLLPRLATELGLTDGQVMDHLTDRRRSWRPVIGVRAWLETIPEGGTAGQDIARVLRLMSAAVKESGTPPPDRPRFLVTARVRDLPTLLPDELELDLDAIAVHWWWGTVGRLDTATFVASAVRPGGTVTVQEAVLTRRVLAAVREEVIGEVCGPDLSLAQRLHEHWDGSDHTLDTAVRHSVEGQKREDHKDLLLTRPRAAVTHKPALQLRHAWAAGLVQAWEGRLRLHPALWLSDGGAGRADRLTALVGQAQSRVLAPWTEEARSALAVLALDHALKPVAELVTLYVDDKQRLADHRQRPERTFARIEAGPLYRACLARAVALGPDDLRLLKMLTTTRNILAHRGVLHDSTLRRLCEELAAADQRWSEQERAPG